MIENNSMAKIDLDHILELQLKYNCANVIVLRYFCIEICLVEVFRKSEVGVIMSLGRSVTLLGVLIGCFSVFSSAEAQEIDAKKWLSEPMSYVGSDVCKNCHLEHYDAWKRTLHSKMLQDAKKNADVFVTDLDEKTIRADLTELAKTKKLKVPPKDFFVPKKEDVLYTIGSQWKQRYLVMHKGDLKIAPTQFNINSGKWTNLAYPLDAHTH